MSIGKKMGNQKLMSFLIALLALLPFATCYSDFSILKESRYAKGLILVDGATEQAYSKQQPGYYVLQYKLKQKYPAKATLSEISKSLDRAGWRPLKESFLNPGSNSSHVRSWTDFVDSTQSHRVRVHQWSAEWEYDDGSVVSYTLRYNEPDLSTLSIWAIHYPSDVARGLEKEIKRIHSSDPRLSQQNQKQTDQAPDEQLEFNESGDINLLLRAAAENGRLNLVKIAVSRGASVDVTDGYKTTALIAAARNGHIEVVKYLLERGADVNAQARDGTTAVIVAAEKGYVDTLRVLIKNGADLRKNRCGETALNLAKKNGHAEVVALLKAAGIN